MRQLFILLRVSILFIGCGNSKDTSDGSKDNNEGSEVVIKDPTVPREENAPPEMVINNDTLFASIERTPCYGTCPQYSIKIYKSGLVIYEGKRFVNKEGKHKAFLSNNKLLEIDKYAIELGYYELKDRYEDNVTDLPSCTTRLNGSKADKSVFHYGTAPEALVKFEKYLDGLFAKKEWVVKKKE